MPLLLANLAVLLLVYAWILVPILRDGGYVPAWTDEFGYVLDARSFAANGGSLHAARLKEESLSPLFGASTHGPAYILLQGGIARLFGDPVTLSVWPNLVALGLAFGLILAFPLTLAQRLTVVVLLLLHFAVFLYAFTWMVESYQVLFAIAATLLLLKLYRSDPDTGAHTARLAGLALLLLMLSTFRVSYALWALALLPLARNGRELVRYAVIALVVIAGGVLVMRVLSAPNPHWPLSRALSAMAHGDVAGPLAMLAGNVSVNLTRYFVSETQNLTFYMVMKYVVVAAGLFLLGAAIVRRDRLALAAVLVLVAHFALLFLLYDAHTWREQRHLAPVFYLLVVALVAGGYGWACAALYVVLLALFPEVHGYAVQRILPERRWVATQLAAHDDARRSFARLAELVAPSGPEPITVLHAKAYYRNMSLAPLLFPVKSKDGAPIRYTANLGATPDTQRWGRIAIDYVLLPPGAPPEPGWRLVERDPYWVLYDLRSASGAGAGASGSPRSKAGDSLSFLTSSPSSPSNDARSSS